MQFKPLNVPVDQYPELDQLQYRLNAIIKDPKYQVTGNETQSYFEMMEIVNQTIQKTNPVIQQAIQSFQQHVNQVYQFDNTPNDAYNAVKLLTRNINQMVDQINRTSSLD